MRESLTFALVRMDHIMAKMKGYEMADTTDVGAAKALLEFAFFCLAFLR